MEYISQFEVIENPSIKKGFHRHHIVPKSQQTEIDNRCVYLTPAQHLWAHILYDKENETNTSRQLVNKTHKKPDYFDCFEKCLDFAYIFSKEYQNNVLNNSGKNNAFYGQHHTEEARKRISESHIGKIASEETKNKMSESHKGEKAPWYGKHLTEEAKKKLSNANSGKHWYNNGTITIKVFDCPEGFVPGRLYKRKAI